MTPRARSETVELDLRVVIRRIVVHVASPRPSEPVNRDDTTGSLLLAAHEAARRSPR